MGRGGGSSGGSSGGRSFSSGSGRSFGGRSSSGSHRGGGSSFSSSRGSSSGFSGPRPGYRPPPPPPRGGVHVHNHYGGGYYGRRSGSFSGAVTLFVIAMLVILFLAIGMSSVRNNSSGGVSNSTIERTAITPYKSFDRNCIDDRAGWIMDRNVLLKGMESFYKQTGVQPAICITSALDNIDPEEYAMDRYDNLIGHEKGVLLLFYEPEASDWDAWYMAGTQAQTVMDSEACDILLDYVEAYYYDTNGMSDEEYFAAVFRETGDRIMTVTPTVASRIPMILIAVVVIAVIFGVVKAIKLKHARDREEAAETERILHTPIDRL